MSLPHNFTVSVPSQANPNNHPAPLLTHKADHTFWIGSFQAMASECQLLLEGVNQELASALLTMAAIETWRIEEKFSRYKTGNVMDQINHAHDMPLPVDKETESLLNYADQCFQLSDGLFDVTAGVLRRVWRFDGSDAVPTEAQIQTILPFIGWQKVSWHAPFIQLPNKMELDLGGFGKEYAVDKVCLLLQQQCQQIGHKHSIEEHSTKEHSIEEHSQAVANPSVLVNFGGDLACSGPRLSGEAWEVAVESHRHQQQAAITVKLSDGAIATSGDSQRFLLKNGIRYSHILNPKTGHSITDAPRSISVAATTCMQAGMLSTMAMLQGAYAEDFLTVQEADYWVQR